MTNNGAADAPAALLERTPIRIDDLLQNGQGVGRAGDLVTFVTGALPGERARVAVDALKKTYASTHAVEIVERSPDRVESVCPVFPRCGGCQTLHLRYAAQLEWKRGMVREALARLGGLSVEVEPSVTAPLIEGTRYRNKVSLVAQASPKKGAIGFYEARSHHIVPVSACPVVLPWLDDTIAAMARFVARPRPALAQLRHVVVRSGLAHSTLVVCLCTGGRSPALAAIVAELRAAIKDVSGIVESYDPASANAIFGRQTVTHWGSPETVEHVGDTTFRFGITSFFQINTAVLERIAATIASELHGAGRVVDLYCGVGTFAVILARNGTAVTGVESSLRSVEEAAVNAARNGATTAAFECANVADAVTGQRGRTLLEGADAVILDPPRRGCDAAVLHALAGARVPRIEYVSCNPATLSRDARLLVDAGYSVGRVIPFDMFPFTGHVEVLAQFTRPRSGP
ncbi:MAG: 23S rRNA (uracil(1939)-C(5))-methyltransferase RlmD [Candidatus Eremiobacteraeota bacterium]|nr:23S rRNA (uracil(1939)-C(5))-methyltransferase RlmD [Candidatus Eremiobacteraeota bacterium]